MAICYFKFNRTLRTNPTQTGRNSPGFVRAFRTHALRTMSASSLGVRRRKDEADSAESNEDDASVSPRPSAGGAKGAHDPFVEPSGPRIRWGATFVVFLVACGCYVNSLWGDRFTHISDA